MTNDNIEYYIGIDIGGTNIKYLLREKDKILLSGSYESNKIKTREDIINFIYSVVDTIILKYKNENIKGIGIGSKGRVTEEGVIRNSSFIALNNLDLVTKLQDKYEIKTKVVNDASLPYYTIKDKIKDKIILIVTLGTGIGTAIFHNDEKIGNEFFSSEFALSKFRDGVNRDYTSTNFLLSKIKENKLNIETPFELFTLATEECNDVAKKIFKEYGENLGEIFSTLINQYNIDEIYLCGGIIKGKKLFLQYIENSLKKHSKKIPSLKTIEKPYEIGAYGASKLLQ